MATPIQTMQPETAGLLHLGLHQSCDNSGLILTGRLHPIQRTSSPKTGDRAAGRNLLHGSDGNHLNLPKRFMLRPHRGIVDPSAEIPGTGR